MFFPYRTKDDLGDPTDITKLIQKILNKASSARMITKQEFMVLLSDVPLYICSDIVQKVSLSGYVAVTKEKQKSNTILSQYKKQPFNKRLLSLHEFFHQLKNDNNRGKNTTR